MGRSGSARRGSPAGSCCAWRTTGPGSPLTSCHARSSGSAVPMPPAAPRTAAPASAWPSSTSSSARTAAGYRPVTGRKAAPSSRPRYRSPPRLRCEDSHPAPIFVTGWPRQAGKHARAGECCPVHKGDHVAEALGRTWDKRVAGWHSHVTSAAAFGKVLARLLEVACPADSDTCVDLGAGTGFVTLALAPRVSSVLAVDISPAMAESLAGRAREAGLRNVATEVCDLKDFRLPPASVDLVVSSYALHHLSDAGKRSVAAQALTWLRPGGRLVVADMMFGGGACRQGAGRGVADREEPRPLRPARRPGAPGLTGVLAARPGGCRVRQRQLRAGRRGSGHRPRHPPGRHPVTVGEPGGPGPPGRRSAQG